MCFRVDVRTKLHLLKFRRDIVKNKIMTFLRDQDGLTIVEYAVAAGLITAAVAAAFVALGGSVNTIITTVNGYLTP